MLDLEPSLSGRVQKLEKQIADQEQQHKAFQIHIHKIISEVVESLDVAIQKHEEITRAEIQNLGEQTKLIFAKLESGLDNLRDAGGTTDQKLQINFGKQTQHTDTIGSLPENKQATLQKTRQAIQQLKSQFTNSDATLSSEFERCMEAISNSPLSSRARAETHRYSLPAKGTSSFVAGASSTVLLPAKATSSFVAGASSTLTYQTKAESTASLPAAGSAFCETKVHGTRTGLSGAAACSSEAATSAASCGSATAPVLSWSLHSLSQPSSIAAAASSACSSAGTASSYSFRPPHTSGRSAASGIDTTTCTSVGTADTGSAPSAPGSYVAARQLGPLPRALLSPRMFQYQHSCRGSLGATTTLHGIKAVHPGGSSTPQPPVLLRPWSFSTAPPVAEQTPRMHRLRSASPLSLSAMASTSLIRPRESSTTRGTVTDEALNSARRQSIPNGTLARTWQV
eukprot:TRINITY_DN6390_c0_g1_i1.p1 TRINITY_DN6390_c0_g1~~TRINITY_DN6390_c0_g1_i1.p1  ORF type:complete len:455 (-),score=61.74 TRINITY_DN6390_c0_g1_i1:33-1397(-)